MTAPPLSQVEERLGSRPCLRAASGYFFLTRLLRRSRSTPFGFMLARFLSHEPVTRSMHGKEVLRLLGIRLELLAQTYKMRVHCPRSRVVIVSPDVFKQPV